MLTTKKATSYRGRVSMTRFDPIKNTPGTRDYVNASGTIRGSVRESVVATRQTRGTSYRAGPLAPPPAGTAVARAALVPSLPRRSYIPTVGSL